MSQPWQQPGGGGQQRPPQQPGSGQPGPYGPPPQGASQPPPQQQQPQQPPGYGYPQQPPSGAVPPQQSFGAPAPAPGAGYPAPAPGPGPVGNRNGPLLAILAGVGLMIVLVFAYGYLVGALFDAQGEVEDAISTGSEIEYPQWAYIAVVIGALIALPFGKLAPRNWALGVLGAALAFLTIFLGEMFAYATVTAEIVDEVVAMGYSADQLGMEDKSAFGYFFGDFGDVFDSWQETATAVSWIFLILAPAAFLAVFKRLSDQARPSPV